MPVAENIRKLGFRRWHERQLIEAHASLVTAFLSMIVVTVCLDQFHWRDTGTKPLIMLALIIAGTALCFKTVTFYFKMLFRAEHFAAQAVCGGCGVYGVLEVLGASVHESCDRGDEPSDGWLKVRCKKCSHHWTMSAQHALPPIGKSL